VTAVAQSDGTSSGSYDLSQLTLTFTSPQVDFSAINTTISFKQLALALAVTTPRVSPLWTLVATGTIQIRTGPTQVVEMVGTVAGTSTTGIVVTLNVGTGSTTSAATIVSALGGSISTVSLPAEAPVNLDATGAGFSMRLILKRNTAGALVMTNLDLTFLATATNTWPLGTNSQVILSGISIGAS